MEASAGTKAVEGLGEGMSVSKGLGDEVRVLDASTEEGMTHGLVGGNIRAAWIGKQGTEGKKEGGRLGGKNLRMSRWCFIVVTQLGGRDVWGILR